MPDLHICPLQTSGIITMHGDILNK